MQQTSQHRILEDQEVTQTRTSIEIPYQVLRVGQEACIERLAKVKTRVGLKEKDCSLEDIDDITISRYYRIQRA